YGLGSLSGFPGPNVAVWVSRVPVGIVKRTVVPVGTVRLFGRKPRYSTPPLPAAPTLTVFAGTCVLARLAAVFRSAATWLLTTLATAATDGIFLLARPSR